MLGKKQKDIFWHGWTTGWIWIMLSLIVLFGPIALVGLIFVAIFTAMIADET